MWVDKDGSMQEDMRWIAVALLPDGGRVSGTFRSQGQMMKFADKVLQRFPEAIIAYAMPCIITKEKRYDE